MKDYKEFYEKYWIKKINGFDNNINQIALSRIPPITSLLPSSKSLGKVLDAGCGDGTILYLLKENYIFEPYGIDISQNAVKKAIERGIDAQVSDLSERIPFPDESFDLIICSEVLEHLYFPEKALREINRVAKNDAIIIFSIPNIAYIQHRIRFLLGKSIFFNPKFQSSEHIRFWTKSSFFELLKRENFKPETSIGTEGHTVLYNIFKREELLSKYLFIKTTKISSRFGNK